MARLIIDSSALLAFMNPRDRHHKTIVKRLLQSDDLVSISVITFSEALVHAYEVEKDDLVIRAIKNRVADIFDVSAPIAQIAAELRASAGLTLPDALIAATAKVHSLRLLTFDRKLAAASAGAELLTS